MSRAASSDDLVRRQLRLRHEVSVQRHAVRRAYRHGETRGTLSRMQEALRRLELELDDVERVLHHRRQVA